MSMSTRGPQQAERLRVPGSSATVTSWRSSLWPPQPTSHASCSAAVPPYACRSKRCALRPPSADRTLPPKRSHAAALRRRLAIALENHRTLQGNIPPFTGPWATNARSRPGHTTPPPAHSPARSWTSQRDVVRTSRCPTHGGKSREGWSSAVDRCLGWATPSRSLTPCPRALRHPRSGLPLEQISSSYAHADLLQDPENLPGLGRLRVPPHRLHLLGSRVAGSAGPRVRPRIHGGSLRPVGRRCDPGQLVSAAARRGKN